MAKNDSGSQINEVSRIAEGTIVKGSLGSEYDIRIDGKFEGDLITKGKLVVGNNAYIKGNIVCDTADIWGHVEGDLVTAGVTSFKSVANFMGNLKTSRIAIEIGAVFNGTCKIISDEEFATLSKGA